MKSWTAAMVAVGVLAGSTAHAETPDPWEDYEAGVKLAPEDTPSDDGATPSPDASAGPYRVKAWTWSTGAGWQFAYTHTNNGVLTGGDESSETLYTRFTPNGRVFVVDNVEVGLTMGIFSKFIARENDRSARETGFLMEAEGFYHYPLGGGFALVPGLGLGFYAGGSSRDLVLPTGVANESTSTVGFSGTLHLTAGYQPHPNWRLRSGMSVGLLAGSESVGSQDATLSSTAVHVTLPLEVSYVF